MNFILKKDYLSISLFILIYFSFYFYFKETYQALVPTIIGGLLGVTIGYFIAVIVHKKTFYIRLISFCITLIAFSIIAYLSKQPDNKQKSISNNLTGTWTSDNSDNIIIKMKFQSSKVSLSMSPQFEEFAYDYTLKGNSIILSKDEKAKFRWLFSRINKNAFELQNVDDKLIFVQQN